MNKKRVFAKSINISFDSQYQEPFKNYVSRIKAMLDETLTKVSEDATICSETPGYDCPTEYIITLCRDETLKEQKTREKEEAEHIARQLADKKLDEKAERALYNKLKKKYEND